MPNWNSNSVSITGVTTEQAQRIVDACNSNSLLNEFYPQPDWANTPNEDGVYPGPYYRSRWLRTETYDGKQTWRCQSHVNNRTFPDGTTDQRWYNWRTSDSNWGTKWEPEVYVHQLDDGSLQLTFDTAWCPPSDHWFEKLSEAMPDAKIFNSFSESGCDFAGIQFANGGVCLSKCIDISSLFEPWAEKQLSPEQLLIFRNEDHEDYDELYETLREQWYEVQYEVIDEEFSSFINTLPATVSA